jgi:hypothetical protein
MTEEGALLSPETFLTKICIVDAGSGETEREAGDEERILDVCDELGGIWCLSGREMKCLVSYQTVVE